MKQVVDRLKDARPALLVRTVERLGEGDFCVAYLVNDHLVVREAKHRRGARALRMEACLLSRIADDFSVAVPRPNVISEPDPDSNVEVTAVHEFVPGKALTPERWGRLPVADRASLGREVGAFLAKLHSLRVAQVRECRLRVADHEAQVRHLTAQLKRGAGGAALDPVRTALAAALGRYRPGDLAWNGESSVLNGDVSPEHVLFDEDSRRLVGVIDWGDAVIGAAPRDFIFLYEDWGVEFLRFALSGYGSAEDRTFLAQVYLFFLADQLRWTLQMVHSGSLEDVRHGVTGLTRGLDGFMSVGV